jgi:hypothetical protein
MARALRRARFGLVFALLFAMSAAWALSLPLFAGPDEASHMMRATAVVRGQLIGQHTGKPGDQIVVYLKVPKLYTHSVDATCYVRSTSLTPACAPGFSAGHGRVKLTSDEYRAFPVYYAVVGALSPLDSTVWSTYLMRLVSAALCALFLASAFRSALEFEDAPLMALGVAAAVTPEVLFLTGVVNANSLEIAAAICLWSSLLTLLRSKADPSARLIRWTGIAAVALSLTRGLSPLYVAIAFATAALVADRERLSTVLRRRDTRIWIVAVIAAMLVAGGWILYVQNHFPLHSPGIGLADALRNNWNLIRGAIAVPFNRSLDYLHYRDVWMPWVVYGAWGLVVTTMWFIALAFSKRRDTVILVCFTVVAVGLPIVSRGLAFPDIGNVWRGRYALPLLAGIPIFAGAITVRPNKQRAERSMRGFRNFGVVVIATVQLIVFFITLRRFTVGTNGSMNPFGFLLDPTWAPRPGPPSVLALLFLISVTLFAVLLCIARPNEKPLSTSTPGARTADRT